MKDLYDENFQLTDEGIEISKEFEVLIKPFFQKYDLKFNPVHFSSIINGEIDLKLTSYYMEAVTKKLLKN